MFQIDWKESLEYKVFGLYHYSSISFGYSLLAVHDNFGEAQELTCPQIDQVILFYYSDGEI